MKFDWATHPLLTHNGSNSMNLAVVLVDVEQDLGIVVLTNFPEKKAEAAASEMIERLYREYGGKEGGTLRKAEKSIRILLRPGSTPRSREDGMQLIKR